MHEQRFRDEQLGQSGWPLEHDQEPAPKQVSPGKVTLTSKLQRSPSADAIARSVVQLMANPGGAPAAVDPLAVADRAVQGPSTSLPHLDCIQAAFGHHEVREARAHLGADAAAAASSLSARAFAYGGDVVFAGDPDLHTAAHEAAHVVQQRAGISFAGGIGAVGDAHEVHADAVADAVVRGQSAEPLLDRYAPRGAAGGPAVQRITAEARAAAVAHVVSDVAMEQIAHRIAYLDGDLPVTAASRVRDGAAETAAAGEHWTAPRTAHVDTLDGDALTELGFDCEHLQFFTGQAGLQFWMLPVLAASTRTPIIAFRGTATIADLADDTNLVGIGMGQFTMNQAVIQGAIQSLGSGGRGIVATRLCSPPSAPAHRR